MFLNIVTRVEARAGSFGRIAVLLCAIVVAAYVVVARAGYAAEAGGRDSLQYAALAALRRTEYGRFVVLRRTQRVYCCAAVIIIITSCVIDNAFAAVT